MIELIIFDMDGVLLDSEPAITYASMESLAEAGVNAKYEDFKPFTGMGDDRFIEGVAQIYGAPYSPTLKERAYEIYAQKRERVKVFPDSKKLITELKELGYKCSLASAADMTKVKINLECMELSPEVFASLVTGSDVKNKKPDPEIFLKAAEKVGIAPAHSIVVEDALSGVQAAKAAGMMCIGVKTSFSSEELANAGANFTVDNTYDLLNIINSDVKN